MIFNGQDKITLLKDFKLCKELFEFSFFEKMGRYIFLSFIFFFINYLIIIII